MQLSRRIETMFGLLTGVLALTAAFTVMNLNPPDQFLVMSVFYILPALLVAFGSWVHAIGGKKSGLRILFAGGLILIVEWLPAFFVVFYGYGLWGGLFVLTPGVTAMLTMIASWVSRKSINNA